MKGCLSEIHIYPVKSLGGIALEEAEVLLPGLLADRRWLVMDAGHITITGREHPKLLAISVVREGSDLILKAPGTVPCKLSMEAASEKVSFQLFDQTVTGFLGDREVSQWLSDYLGISCFIVSQNSQTRYMQEKYGGKPGDVVSYADSSPIQLISEGSLEDLNSRLNHPVPMSRFRPNLVISGCEPNEEDQWNYLRIGECEFEVNERCKRCVMPTIDPEKLTKSKEPTRTLSTYRPHPRGGVSFGINLVPKKPGLIRVGQEVEVIK